MLEREDDDVSPTSRSSERRELMERQVKTTTHRAEKNPFPDAQRLQQLGYANMPFKLCDDHLYERTFTDVQSLLGKNRLLFALTREPIQRFLSGYVDKCIKYCNFGSTLNSTRIIRYNKEHRIELTRELNKVLFQAGVPNVDRNYIQGEMYKQLPRHATSNNKVREVVEQKFLSDRRLLEIYYYDFVVSGFSYLDHF
ncbi:hypothetical protein COOONC_01804 [Cooperia oncophora]